MNTFPTEIWDICIRRACRDGGQSGRTLSEVSRYIRHVSAPYRYFSLTIRSCKRLEDFLSMVERAPFNSVRIQNLFIILLEDGFSDSAEITDVLRRFYSGPASQLKTLFSSVNGGFNWDWLRTVLPAESLLHLEGVVTVHSGVDHHQYFERLWGLDTEVSVFPILRRFHVAMADQPNFSSDSLAVLTPDLTDAIQTGVLPAAYFINESARSAFIEVVAKCFADLAPSVRSYTFNVQIKDTSAETLYAFERCAQALQKEAHRIRPGAELSIKHVTKVYTEADAFSDWLDVINGGDGCWRREPAYYVAGSNSE